MISQMGYFDHVSDSGLIGLMCQYQRDWYRNYDLYRTTKSPAIFTECRTAGHLWHLACETLAERTTGKDRTQWQINQF